MKKIAVILSGCGVFDGAEIGESILTLLHITKAGAEYQCFAPDVEQMHTINHLTGEEMPEKRNVLIESARIARGDIKPLTELNEKEFDALILPGGFGAAKNLCDFAVKGVDAQMRPDVQSVCRSFAAVKKPAGYVCIAPAMLPMVYDRGVKTTIGNDTDTAAAVNALGGEHVDCTVQDIVVDEANKVVSTPAYMLAQNLVDAENGISKLVEKVINMA